MSNIVQDPNVTLRIDGNEEVMSTIITTDKEPSKTSNTMMSYPIQFTEHILRQGIRRLSNETLFPELPDVNFAVPLDFVQISGTLGDVLIINFTDKRINTITTSTDVPYSNGVPVNVVFNGSAITITVSATNTFTISDGTNTYCSVTDIIMPTSVFTGCP